MDKMRNQRGWSRSFLLVLLLLTFIAQFAGLAEAGKRRRVHITDDLDDVIDDEEDEAWREWGRKKQSSPAPDDEEPPPDLDKMDPSQIQAEMTRRHTGPVFGFVKLRLGVQRNQESVTEIARQWTKLLKTGGTDMNFLGVDLSTIMFTMQRGQDAEGLKDFILEQPDAYEIKIGDQFFRRSGDPPIEEVIEKLQREKDEVENHKKAEL